MVLVNNPGTWRAVYPPLRHAEWHGWTLTDVVFPFFLFIVGVAIPLALGPRLAAGGARRVLPRVLWRAAAIFVLGLVLNASFGFEWATLRIPGVLQRIAVCYLAAAALFLTTAWRTQALVTVGLLLGYWMAMMLIPVPGYGPGDLSPEGNLAGYVDRAVLGPHVWRASRVYDPEGILSTAPALATTLLGVLAGHWLRSGRVPRAIAAGLAAAGVTGVVLGELWGLVFPVNKSLWTSSYALLMAGLALLALAAVCWLTEVGGRRRWAIPFVALGVNALALYFLSSLLARLLVVVRLGAEGRPLQAVLFETLFASWASPVNASFAYALAYVLVWWFVMWVLYRRNIRLRV
jgi:predicted acyltransferase